VISYCSLSDAAVVTWVGPSVGLWSRGQNWNSGVVPTANDDVRIWVSANVTINSLIPVVVHSLDVGVYQSLVPTNLYAYSTLIVAGTLTIENPNVAIYFNGSSASSFSYSAFKTYGVTATYVGLFFLSGSFVNTSIANGLAVSGLGQKWFRNTIVSSPTFFLNKTSIQLEQNSSITSPAVFSSGSVTISSQDGSGKFAPSTMVHSGLPEDTITISSPANIGSLKITTNTSANFQNRVTIKTFVAPSSFVTVSNGGQLETPDVESDELSIISGSVFTNTITVNSLNLTGGNLELADFSSAETFFFFGGSIHGINALVPITNLQTFLVSNAGKKLDSVVINTKLLEQECDSACNLILLNGAGIKNQSFIDIAF